MKAALIALLACAAPRPAVHNESNAGVRFFARTASAERPVVDFSTILPEPMDFARWPLAASVHPVLEPRFDIAKALAQPGMTWNRLCALGADQRHLPGAQDLVEYLRAWCYVEHHDVEGAVLGLARLEQSPVLGLRDALALDIADVLASSGDANDAEKALAKANITDLDVFDILSATYFEIGKVEDAYEITRVAVGAGGKDATALCRRIAKNIVIAHELERGVTLEPLHKLAASNATCARLNSELTCWTDPGSSCQGYLRDQAIDQHYEPLLRAYYHWPTVPADYDTWLVVADNAQESSPLPGAAVLAITALEAALAASQCKPTRIDRIQTIAKEIGPYDARLTALRAMNPQACVTKLSR